jgi:hypothetical protein
MTCLWQIDCHGASAETLSRSQIKVRIFFPQSKLSFPNSRNELVSVEYGVYIDRNSRLLFGSANEIYQDIDILDKMPRTHGIVA